MNRLQVRRGTKANVPTLLIGEPALTTDTNEMIMGTSSGNQALNFKDPAYGTSSTAAATGAKVSTIIGFVRRTGSLVGIKFDNANTAAMPTLNVNNTGSANIIDFATGIAPVAGRMGVSTHLFMFNGTQWVLL